MSNHQTVDDLSEQTLAKLIELIRINADAKIGLEEAADELESPDLKSLFVSIASKREAHARELLRYVHLNQGSANLTGTYLGALHRCWMKLRTLCTKDDRPAVLSEAEFGEGQIVKAYEAALKETADSPIHDVLQSQHAEVKSASAKIRNLREMFTS